MKIERIVYISKPFYQWFLIVIAAAIFVPTIAHIYVDINYLIVSFIIIYLVAFFSVKRFTFLDNSFCRKYLFRFKNILGQKTFKYSSLKVLEIRNLKEPYQRPYVILHFSKGKKMDSIFFSNRAFIYNSTVDLIPLIKHFIVKDIPIKLNMTNDYDKNNFNLKEFIKKENGVLYQD